MTALAAAVLLAAAGVQQPQEPLRVRPGETLTFEHPGATAAYAVDPAIADASAHGGKVTIHGRSPGATHVPVVTLADVATFTVVVEAPPPPTAPGAADSWRAWSAWEAGYESATERLTSAMTAASHRGDRTARLHLMNVTRAGELTGGDARSAFPSASFELSAPRREVVLLDRYVEHSPLSLDRTSLRGLHLRAGGLELHAGYTSPLLYRSVILPMRAEAAIGASYRVTRGGSSLAPVAYLFPGPSSDGGTSGGMGSLLYEGIAREGKLRATAEVGYGRKLGAAASLAHEAGGNRVWLEARHRPAGFSSLGLGRASGSYGDAAWASELLPRLRLHATGSVARHEIAASAQRTVASSAELRVLVSRGWSTSAGTHVGLFDAAGASPVRTLTLPLGISYDGQRLGAAAIYRHQRNTANDEGGHGGRVTVRGSWGPLRASAFADGQQFAPTVDFVLRELPGLAQAFAELGLTARTPDDIARLLRENSTLAELGYLEGLTVNLSPWRLQTGGELAWVSRRGDGEARLRVLVDRTRAVRGLQETAIASLSCSRRLVRQLELVGGAGLWSRALEDPRSGEWSFSLGVRVRLDGLPGVPSALRRGAISGSVHRDDEGSGSVGPGTPPMPGVRVRLDGESETVTDALGRFRWEGVSGGPHRVEVVLPSEAGAYFTTPSAASVAAGGQARFGIAHAPARIAGFVRNDAGAGLAGVRLRLAGKGREELATTGPSGQYAFAVAEGEWLLAIDGDSLPAGYDGSDLGRAVELDRATPARSDFVVAASRSVSGTVRAKRSADVEVRLLEARRAARTDKAGRYVFRNLAPGAYTVAAVIEGRTIRRTVEVPEGPAAIRGVDLGPR